MTACLLLLFGLVFMYVCNTANAGETKTALAPTAAVVPDGETLLHVRGIKNYTAQFRANGIAERIKRLAEDPYLSKETSK
jgi:hypothetical protein